MKKAPIPLITIISLMGAILSFATAVTAAESFRVGIMQDHRGAAASYASLLTFLESKGIGITLVGYGNYGNAAQKFASGEVDAMFAGSGVAGTMIIKRLAYPLVRPVAADGGWSTYWAVVLAPKGSPAFTGEAAYFGSKRIICCSLASSGEFFARSLLGPRAELLTAASHGAAITALSRGAADIAIVKNRVWDQVRAEYPGLEKAGEDNGENPDNALMVSAKADKAVVDRIGALLLGLETDASESAMTLKRDMKISGFIPTTEQDFTHTLSLLKKAGVTPDFPFSY